MILDELVLENFRALQGRQSLKLRPPDSKRPIVLLGGENGSGKTTILEALHLALYGKLGTYSRQNCGSYEKYLERAISHGVRPRDGASVELSFRAAEGGQECVYRIRRAWSRRANRIREDLHAFRDGRLDTALSDTWAEQVDRFIPARLAHLFFFDGERVETLADPDRSATILATALDGLLGLELAEQLAADLVLLERRKSREVAKGPDGASLEKAEELLNSLRIEQTSLRGKRATIQTKHDRSSKLLREATERLAAAGGDLLASAESVERALQNAEEELRAVDDALVLMAGSALPLLLVQDLLRGLAARYDQQQRSRDAEVLRGSLEQVGTELDELLRKQAAGEAARAIVREYLATKRSEMADSGGESVGKGLEGQAGERLRFLLREHGQGMLREAETALRRGERIEAKMEEYGRLLIAIPDEEALAALKTERQELSSEVNSSRRELTALDERLTRLEAQIEQTEDDLNKLVRKQREADLRNQDVKRVLTHSARVRRTLDLFRERAREAHLQRIEGLVTEGFQRLLHKQNLVAATGIDPLDCRLKLIGRDGTSVGASELSAGERQLLAVSLLWGLGRAASKPLPVVIDTPLGRLDQQHRRNLVERYFPFASHQVILLSTDEEIDSRYYEMLRKHIGHEYRLEHSDETRSSRVEEGYFPRVRVS